MNKKITLIFFIFLFFLLSNFAFAEEEVVLYEFSKEGCPYCDALDHFLKGIEDDYPNLVIKKYDIQESDNVELLLKMSKAFDEEVSGVPVVFINNKIIEGFNNQKKEIIEEEIQKCSLEECEDPIDKIDSVINIEQKITIPVLISAAAVDAINPCAFAVLVLLLGTILVSGKRKRALLAGLAFIIAIFISYFLIGVGLYSAIGVSGITNTFYIIVALLAILIGLFNLKDYLWYGKWFIMEVPLSWRPKMKKLIRNVTSIPGAFLIGFIISLFLLPCTSGPYIVILGLLAKVATRNTALLLLLLYNFVFILPMLIITLLIYFGFTTTEKAEEWRKKKLKVLHLIAGIVILLLGIGMLVAVFLGMI